VLITFISTLVLLLYLLRGMREKKQAERLLQQEQQFSDLVINFSHQGIVILDESLKCLLWNPGSEALLGIPAQQVVGAAIAASVPLFGRERVADALVEALRGRSATVEEDSVFPDHRSGCIEVSCHHLRMSERDLVIAFLRDVTEQWQKRKHAEQQNVDLEIKVRQRTAALRQAESRLLAAIQTAPDGFAAFDTNGKLLIANERIRSIDPLRQCDRDDMSLAAFLTCFALCEGADDRLLTIGHSFEPLELDLRLQAESWAHLSVSRADQGTVFVRLTDVTPYKKAALALQSALDRERQTTSAYRSFVSMISHQFRTPLAIIDSSAQRLMRRGHQIPEDEIETRIAKIRSAVTRLTRLVESVLNAARIDAGQIEFNPRNCDLLDLVSDICERQRELTPKAVIRLFRPSFPVEVVCDVILIEQVVSNLLSNAVKYSGNTVVVEVEVAVQEERVVCSVRDWGVGIPTDELPRIFDRFYRARTATGIAGTGIGLDVARQILQMHGGDIRAESREGEGSVFTFTMPTATAATAPQAA
jgi:PAS domain S-box-containing protein